MPTRNINLTTQLDGFVEANIRGGRFANASEVVRAGLALLEQRQHEEQLRYERLRAAAAAGMGALDSGDFVELEGEAELRHHIAEIGRTVRAKVPAAEA